MSQLLPSNTTVGDICTAALQESGRLGVGQTALAEDMNKAWARLQWMLQQWERKRWLVYQLVDYSIVSTGATSYTFGPGGQINTNQVLAWSLSSLAPVEAGEDYFVGEVLTLSAAPASGTPSSTPYAQVTEIDADGGVVAVQTTLASVGSILFASNPIAGDTITLNGVVWTFVGGTAGTAETEIQGTAGATLTQLVSDLNASEDEDLTVATYSTTGAIATSNLRLRIMYDSTGTDGDDYTLAASSATVSGSTLSGGMDEAVVYPGPLPNLWSQDSTTGAGFNCTLGYAEWTQADPISISTGTVRPAKIESAFLRQISASQPSQIDYPLDILEAKEDYNKIALKQLQSFPGSVFLDTAWPLAQLYCWPVPQSAIYSINVTVRQQLPTRFASLSTALNLPDEYYGAMMYNLALRLRGVFSIPTFPGDPLPSLAKDSLNVLRPSNAQIARLGMPPQLMRRGIYNIFSDRNY